jgi:transcriptional regulator with XRE-family HTH domain
MLSVGSLLKQERLKKNLPLTQVEKETKIRRKFLEAIENNDWTIFSSKIYITGLLKNYARYLGLDHNKIIAFFRRDYEKREDLNFTKGIAQANLKPETRKILYGLLTIVFTLFFVYFAFQVKLYLSPPKVSIVSPKESTFRGIDRITIVGKTEKEASINIFGEQVFGNKDGQFTYDYPLKKGKNTLVIKVTGANGKQTTLTKDYTLE